jgi:hypothetical protein
MGRRDFQSTVADALPVIIQENAKEGIGSVKFTKRDKQHVGKIYFRNGSIYAVEVSTYAPSIVNRIATNEYITESARAQVLQKFENDVTNLDVVKYVLTYQLFPEKPLVSYIKDYFLDALDILYSWTEVNAEWRNNDEPSVPTVPNANPNELISKINKRQEYLQNEIGFNWGVQEDKLGNVHFVRNESVGSEVNDYIQNIILSLGDGNWSIEGIATYLGLSHFNTKVSVFQLWQYGLLDIITPEGKRVSSQNQIDEKKTVSQPDSNIEKPPVIEPQERLIEEQVRSQPEREKQANRSPLAFPRQEKVAPVENKLPVVAEEPKVVVEPPLAPIESKPIIEETIPELETKEEPAVSSENSFSEFEMPAPSNPEQQASQPVTTSGSRGASASSRISRIAQQLREELLELKQAIDSVEQHKNSIESYVNSLQTERNNYVEKLRSLDNKISEGKKTLEEKVSEINALKSDYQESINLTKGLDS